MTESALYVGRVSHARHTPRPHRFGYRTSYCYLDLDEVETVFDGRWLWSYERANVASFRRRDYLGDPVRPLKDAVRARCEEVLGEVPGGPVRLLTHLRYLGYGFNPVSFYYIFEEDGETLGAVVAEITNTPWGERHSYVLGSKDAGRAKDLFEWRFAKAFHVSPFFDMDQQYVWRFSRPEERLVVAMENYEGSNRVFDASLVLERRPLDGRSLAGHLARHPWTTGAVQAAIHWQALRLWLKRTPFFTHPDKR